MPQYIEPARALIDPILETLARREAQQAEAQKLAMQQAEEQARADEDKRRWEAMFGLQQQQFSATQQDREADRARQTRTDEMTMADRQLRPLMPGIIAPSAVDPELQRRAGNAGFFRQQSPMMVGGTPVPGVTSFTGTPEQHAARAVSERATADDARQDRALAETMRHNRATEGQSSTASEPLVSVMGPDGKPVLVPRSQAAGRTPASTTARASSGVERRTLNFFNRAHQADKDLEAVEDQIQALNLGGQAWMEWAPNFLQSDTGQAYRQAQRAFTEARLRKDSGAAIPDHEFANDRATYFVQPGDSEATQQQKRQARAAVLASLAFESGQALGEFVGDPDEARQMVEGFKSRADGGGDTSVQTPDGQTFTFPTPEAAAEFKRRAGIP